MKGLIFISSVQKELADKRRTIRDLVRGGALLDAMRGEVQTGIAVHRRNRSVSKKGRLGS